MSRASLIKQLIRLGMRAVPNDLAMYRMVALAGPILFRPPKGFQIDSTRIGDIPVMWVNHAKQCSSRVILYLHGGGYAFGSNRTHLELTCRIAKAARAQILMVEYRLAPEHPYPAALEDAVAVYRYLLAARIAPEKIVVAGDSAGGGLTLSMLQALRNRRLPSPAAAVCLSPWLDLSCSMSTLAETLDKDPLISPERIRYFANKYAGVHDRTQPGLSPFFGDLNDLPPILIQVGGDEVLLPECKLFSRRARQFGCRVELQVWPDMFHVWQFAARFLPEGRKAIHQIGMFVREMSPV
ncbi:MAG: alpha/beta hydrolase [Hahellaceae bacterium]|nr:alpha/beta hydrolase [Hahellaceae bacterium]MCP5169386.1 alpha/beta hydrolase [Hahellaceae bacterium]